MSETVPSPALDEAGVDLSALETMPGLPSSTTVLAVDSAGRRPNFHALGAGMLAWASPAALEVATTVADATDPTLEVDEELLLEEVSIDGMCGVY